MIRRLALLAVAAFLSVPAAADPWKDESGHRGPYGGEWKQEYRDGACKIERKWEPGEYKEEVECDRAPWWTPRPAPPIVLGRAPAALPAPPAGPDYGEVYVGPQGRYCREYRTWGTIDGRRERLYGTVCLDAGGNWAFAD